jgi:hypothetical protein
MNLTPKIIDGLEAGGELDALVAERLFNWKLHPRVGIFAQPRFFTDRGGLQPEDCPEFSTDIAAAWEVFVRLGPAWQVSQSDWGGWADDQRWWCWLPKENGGDGTITMAPTAPIAICKAALLTMVRLR